MPLSPEQEKLFLTDSKRWLSFYKQAYSAYTAGKHKRYEQLLNEGMKVVRRMKQVQLEAAPEDQTLAEIADDFVLAGVKGLGMSYWDAEDESAGRRCLPFLLEAATLLEASKNPKYESSFEVYEALCQVYVALKQPLQYEEVCRRALALKEKEVGQWHPEIVSYLMDLAWALEEQGKYSESATLKRDALRICENDKGPAHPEVIALKHGLACANFLNEGLSPMEAIQKALATLTDEERKKFTGGVAAELESMR
jgi:tetratricopeptide (TPR) repeat protein